MYKVRIEETNGEKTNLTFSHYEDVMDYISGYRDGTFPIGIKNINIKQVNDFGYHLKRRREELGVSQKELAQKMGVTQAAVCKWEKNSYISEQNKAKIKRILWGEE